MRTHKTRELDTPTPRTQDTPGRDGLYTARLARKMAQRRLARRAQEGGDENGVASGAESVVEAAPRSGGAALPREIQRKYESSTGADLSGVRVHTDQASAAAADSVSARAFTMGQDVYFGAGEYDPCSSEGERLLAHEVAHTVQQGDGVSRKPQFKLEVSSPADTAELEADRAADRMVSGQGAAIEQGPSAARMRAPKGGGDEKASKETESDSDHDRRMVSTQLGVALSAAYTDYMQCCAQILTEEKERLAANAELFGLIIEIAGGFLIPGLGKLVTKGVKGLAGLIPEASMSAILKTTIHWASEGENAAKMVESATSGAVHKMKEGMSEVGGLDDFLLNFAPEAFKTHLLELAGQSIDWPMDKLVSTYGFFAAVKPMDYKESIKATLGRFQNAQALGGDFMTEEDGRESSVDTHPYHQAGVRWITNLGNKKLAYVGQPMLHIGAGDEEHDGDLVFNGWVPDDMIEVAIQTNGAEPDTLAATAITFPDPKDMDAVAKPKVRAVELHDEPQPVYNGHGSYMQAAD